MKRKHSTARVAGPGRHSRPRRARGRPGVSRNGDAAPNRRRPALVDATRLDVFAATRPTLTCVVDKWTRMIVGWHLS